MICVAAAASTSATTLLEDAKPNDDNEQPPKKQKQNPFDNHQGVIHLSGEPREIDIDLEVRFFFYFDRLEFICAISTLFTPVAFYQQAKVQGAARPAEAPAQASPVQREPQEATKPGKRRKRRVRGRAKEDRFQISLSPSDHRMGAALRILTPRRFHRSVTTDPELNQQTQIKVTMSPSATCRSSASCT